MSDTLVIIPTYNEKDNVGEIIRAIFSLPVAFDILIVDDNSPDGTAGLVSDLMAQFNASGQRLHLLKRNGKLGLGTAYLAGFRYALERDYQFVIEMDADFSHDPKDLVALYKACTQDGCDVSIGSRYATGVNVVNWPMGRVLLSYCASAYVRLITNLPIRDTTAGYVCYRRNVLKTIPLEEVKFVGYAFQIEMKFLAWKYGFRLKEIPIIFKERTRGHSKMSAGIFKEAFFGVLQMTIQSWFRKYIPANS